MRFAIKILNITGLVVEAETLDEAVNSLRPFGIVELPVIYNGDFEALIQLRIGDQTFPVTLRRTYAI